MTPEKKAHQLELEKLFNKNQLLPRLREIFGTQQAMDFMESKGIDPKFGITLLSHIALHKRCDVKTMFGILRTTMPTLDEVAQQLILCIGAGLVNYNRQYAQFIVAHNISDELQAEFDRFQFPLPMVVEPKKVKKNSDTGYLTGSGSLILKKNHHNDDIVLDHINRMNSIAFCINETVAKLIKNQWRNLDRKKDDESVEDFNKRKKAFEKYDRTAHEVIALIIKEGNEFYLTHKYDKRGRVYSQGYHVNYQGTAWNKAVIELAEGEITLD